MMDQGRNPLHHYWPGLATGDAVRAPCISWSSVFADLKAWVFNRSPGLMPSGEDSSQEWPLADVSINKPTFRGESGQAECNAKGPLLTHGGHSVWLPMSAMNGAVGECVDVLSPCRERNADPMKRDNSFTWRRVDAASLDLKGLKVAIVGGTGGIGRAISRFMDPRGASVVAVGQTFRDSEVPGIQFVKADLSLMREAQRVGQALPAEALDLVIFTTGILPGPKREETAEGIERDMAVSYLSRLVIVREIGPRLGKDRPAARMKPRVFIMGFPGVGQTGRLDELNSEKSYGRWTAHMNTVAGNEVLVLHAARRYPNANFFGLNPGFIKTNIRTNLFGGDTLLYRFTEWMLGLIASSPESYADRITPLLVSPDLEGHSGVMFDRKGRAILPSPKLTDSSYVNAFVAASEALMSRAGVRLAS
jgi:NAD(P)-dependent dehydrogenase (short-subunit alcohol dehydrogenase family)